MKMEDSQGTVSIIMGNETTTACTLDLSDLPPIYVMPTHLSVDEQHEAEDTLKRLHAPLTYDIKEANIVLGKIFKLPRAKLELRWKGLRVEAVDSVEANGVDPSTGSDAPHHAEKKRKVSQSRGIIRNHGELVMMGDNLVETLDTADEADIDTKPASQISRSELNASTILASSMQKENFITSLSLRPDGLMGRIVVVTFDWLKASVSNDKILPLDPFTVLVGRILPTEVENPVNVQGASYPADDTETAEYDKSSSILERAKSDARIVFPKNRKRSRIAEAAKGDVIGKSFLSSTLAADGRHVVPTAQLLRQTTSENEESFQGALPTMPEWVIQNKIYSCERSTPVESPNEDFINLLKKIRLARELTLDQIGVRAYSTSIASLAAYPRLLQSSREVLALPGCDAKVSHLFHEYETNDGQIQAVVDLEADPALTILREFYEIWGVGAATAREFYYDKGWRDLDDIIVYGWNTLSRVQQIGLKYYDEFQLKLTRGQVQDIAATITHHAKLVADDKIQSAIVGGYRRGKPENSDVDVMLSHPDQSQTQGLISKVITSLEKEGWITQTLTLNTANSKRDQEPLSVIAGAGHGFDTLDKALVVWQDPAWLSEEADLASNPKAKNPNPHRRVDIIISPWRTIGCAVAGWTSGTTFQRDLRRYCKKVKGWKFDSSGVRERASGNWVDLEQWTDPRTRCKTWEEAEKRVFEGLELVWREPWERCTG